VDGLTIRNLARVVPEGAARPFYTAEVVNGDTVVPVTREFGSWLVVDTPHLRECRPLVAAALQREVGKLERAERRAQGEAVPDAA
jgi:hypothetical protein